MSETLTFKTCAGNLVLSIMVLLKKVFFYISVKLKIAEMPTNSNWIKFYGVGILTGIGFTMSLFVGNLAFVDYTNSLSGVKIGVLVGSFLSAVVGYFLLLIVTKKSK